MTATLTPQARFQEALDSLLEEVKDDRQILAAILCGSLAYDVVWDKSDIDLVFVSADDKKVQSHSLALVVDDINIHAQVVPRAEFRRELESAFHNSCTHSVYARGSLVYSRDPSIDKLFRQIKNLGERDLKTQVLNSAQLALALLYKARKWYEVKDDIAYTTTWLLGTASAIADIEICLHGELVDRDCLPRALPLNPSLFSVIYADLITQPVTRAMIEKGLVAIDEYLESKADALFSPVLKYLQEAGGEPRSMTQIEHYFRRNYGIEGLALACEWLSDIGAIEKASTDLALTPLSRVRVQELAFFYARPT
ncbi:MAG: hypothetical protein F4X56_03070 [Gammaproteobacteria bacterium]|nr:hypothetical protein [Gammaproteobacteria bacterium]MYC24884.1 hypothetical protein [Gammaproteobacteria bacterium]